MFKALLEHLIEDNITSNLFKFFSAFLNEINDGFKKSKFEG